jgi:hypothetical protein
MLSCSGESGEYLGSAESAEQRRILMSRYSQPLCNRCRNSQPASAAYPEILCRRICPSCQPVCFTTGGCPPGVADTNPPGVGDVPDKTSLGVTAIQERTLPVWMGWFTGVMGVILLVSVLFIPLFAAVLFGLVLGIALTVRPGPSIPAIPDTVPADRTPVA